MRVLILAAGQGTRLAPLTDDRPKCMVELAGVSLLQRQTATLDSLNITDVTVIAGYRAQVIEAAGFKTIINQDFASSNMVHSLFCASRLMDGEDDLIIAYGDIVYEPKVINALMASDSPMSVVVDMEWRRYWELRMEDPLADAETMKIDEQGLITELGKKPRGLEEIQGQYIGLIQVRKDNVTAVKGLYEAMDNSEVYDGQSFQQMYMTSFLQHAIESGWPVKAVPISNGWLEVDTVGDLELYRRMESEGALADFYKLGL